MVSFRPVLAFALKWTRKLALLGVAGASIVAIDSLQEYAIGIGLLVLALIGFTAWVYEWKGVEGKRVLNWVSKGVLWAVTAVILLLLAIVYVKLKGQKPWSNIETLDRAVVRLIADIEYIYNVAPWRLLASFAGGCIFTLVVIWFQRRIEGKTAPGQRNEVVPQQEVVVADSLRGCQDEWLHEQLKTDKATIWHLVWVAAIFYRPDFSKSQPRVDFVFHIFNNSLLDVVVSMEGGYILFSDDNEGFHFDPKFIGQNPTLCKSRDDANFVIRQAVTPDEISNHFKSTDNTRISFGNLSVSFRGTEQFPEITPTRLDVNHYLFTGEGVWHNPNRPKFLSEQESVLPIERKALTEAKKPKLVFLRVEDVLVYYDEFYNKIRKWENKPRTSDWRRDHPAFTIIVAWYRNEPQERMPPNTIHNLTGELTYKTGDHPYVIPRGLWFPHHNSAIDIAYNDVAGIILAELYKTEVIYVRDGFKKHDTVELGKESLTVSVRLFSGTDGSMVEGGTFKIEYAKDDKNNFQYDVEKID